MENIKYIIKVEITNSVNDDMHIEWFFTKTEEEKTTLISEKKEEQNKWNHHTPGAMSWRYYSITEYSPKEILELDISELTGMKLRDFLSLLLRTNYEKTNTN